MTDEEKVAAAKERALKKSNRKVKSLSKQVESKEKPVYRSKKAWAAFLCLIDAVAFELGHLSETGAFISLGVFGIYMISQGLADMGKNG